MVPGWRMMVVAMMMPRGRTVWVSLSRSVGWVEWLPATPRRVMVWPPGAMVTVVKPRGWGKTMTWRRRKAMVLRQRRDSPIWGLWILIATFVVQTLRLHM